jgi:hypothetical protein
MKGENVLSFSFKKSNQTVTLAAKTKTKSDSDFPTTDIYPLTSGSAATPVSIFRRKTNRGKSSETKP